MHSAHPKLSLSEFLAWEAAQSSRHEYVGGEVRDTDSAHPDHAAVVANLARHLGKQLKGSPCWVFSEIAQVQAGEDVFYLDVAVTCETVRADTRRLAAPVAIVEVVSAATCEYDWKTKFAAYKRLASLREYVLVDPDSRTVAVFRTPGDGVWAYVDCPGPDLALTSIGCRVPLGEIFQGLGKGGARGKERGATDQKWRIAVELLVAIRADLARSRTECRTDRARCGGNRAAPRTSTSQLLAEWHGQVLTVDGDQFTAALIGIHGVGVAGEREDAVLPVEDVDAADRKLIEPGALFRLCVSRETAHGSLRRSTTVVFRRTPVYRREELIDAQARAADLYRGLRLE